MSQIKKYILNHKIDLGLTLGSILITCLMHWIGFFDFLELKTYDYRFNKVRGPLSGWRASDSTIISLGTDVVLVDVDDETWRILSESDIVWPYPRRIICIGKFISRRWTIVIHKKIICFPMSRNI